MAERNRLQPGEPLASAGVTAEDRQLALDQLAAAVGEDRRTRGQTCPLLLAAPGGESSDKATVRSDGGANRGAPVASGVEKPPGRKKNSFPTRPGRGEVSEKSLRAVPAPGAKGCQDHFRDFWAPVGGNPNGRSRLTTRVAGHKIGPLEAKMEIAVQSICR
jgi:hypothetical protein